MRVLRLEELRLNLEKIIFTKTTQYTKIHFRKILHFISLEIKFVISFKVNDLVTDWFRLIDENQPITSSLT